VVLSDLDFLNTKGEEEKTSPSSTLVKSTILENPEEIGKQIILLAKTSNEISLVCKNARVSGEATLKVTLPNHAI
jgi:hypothetical protein